MKKITVLKRSNETVLTGTIVSGSGSGIRLSKNDLPKFQLKSQQEIPFENQERYDNVEHFLRTFEKVIYSAAESIDVVWRRYIGLTLSYDHDAWLETDLNECQSWVQAKKLFVKKFGNSNTRDEAIRKVYNTFMGANETINGCTTRFLRYVHDSERSKSDPSMVEKYGTSLFEGCQTPLLITVLESRAPEKSGQWSIDEVQGIAVNIFGNGSIGDKCGGSGFKIKGEDHGAGNGGSSRKKTSAGSGSPAGSARKGGASGGFFCPRHGGASSNHDAANCFSLGSPSAAGSSNTPRFLGKVNAPFAATKNESRPCRYCKKPWVHGHKCKEFYEAKDKKNYVTVLAIRADIDDAKEEVDPDNVREAMEEDDLYHCKYDDSKSENKINDPFKI
jgi:hypothetical protein